MSRCSCPPSGKATRAPPGNCCHRDQPVGADPAAVWSNVSAIQTDVAGTSRGSSGSNCNRVRCLSCRAVIPWVLLWLLVLCGCAALLARSRARDSLHAWAMAVVSTVSAGFFLVTWAGAQPFARRLPAPADGAGPNPLLADHPAMAFHPPLLYLGYVGLVVPFGYALAALLAGRADRQWLEATRTWVLGAWCCLTAGIALGAWWSYAVLGWGGYWAWDPVENASLLPWLTATALLHTLIAGRRTPAFAGLERTRRPRHASRRR